MAKPIDRGNGQWELRARIRTHPVTKKPEYLYGTFTGGPRLAQKAQNKLEDEAAKERLARETREAGGEVTEDTSTYTVADALEAYWTEHGQYADAPRTIRRAIDNYLLPVLGIVELGRLRGQLSTRARERNPQLVDISVFYAGIKLYSDRKKSPAEQRTVAPETVWRIHSTFRAALQHAVREGWLAQNPAADAKKPVVKRRASTTPEAKDLAVFMTRVRQRHLMLYVFALLVGSGVRPVEAYALRWRHFDLDAGVLSTDASGMVQGEDGFELREGETKKRRVRTIVLDPLTLAALRAYRKWWLECAMASGARLRGSSFLFSLDPGGENVRPGAWASGAWRRQRESALKQGIDIPAGMRLYDVRHFLATQALSKGHSPSEVAERMGNSQQTVVDFYGHGTRAGDKAIAATMGEAWGIPVVEEVR